MDFISEFVVARKAIHIPLLQRNYVQGGDAEIINSFLYALLKGDCDLNYIYGYDEPEGFVAIDGQQRLITLWLFHLYIYARKKEEFCVPLGFMGREFANDFCSRLSQKLGEVLGNMEAGESLCDAIEDQPWFIGCWKESVTVCNMLATLDCLHEKLRAERQPALSSITFSFLDMGSDNGLDDDIYLKMNGRGRPLSRFENLKAFMDKKVATLPLKDEWRKKIDNEWTDMLWSNRNKKKEHPEELDHEFMACFCNLLVLYYVKHIAQLEDTLAALDEHAQKELSALLGCNDKEPLNAERVVDAIRKDNFLPFSWIEMPADFFEQAMEWMDRLCAINTPLNSLNLLFDGDKRTSTYKLAMSEGSYNNTLPKLYAALCYRPEQHAEIADWMRVTRNLIQNTSIDFTCLPKVLDDIDSLCEATKACDIYRYLASIEPATLPHFDKAQVTEEIEKAKFLLCDDGTLNTDRYKCLNEAETYAFFRGSVRFLLRNAAGEYSTTEEEFSEKWKHAKRYFDDNGVNETYATDSLLLRRLISHFSVESDNHIYHLKYDHKLASTWREILLKKHLCAPVHALLMTDDVHTYEYDKYTLPADHMSQEEKLQAEKYAREILVRTHMLNGVEKECVMHWFKDVCGGSYALGPARGRAQWRFYFLDPRIELLYADPGSITFYHKHQENYRAYRLLIGKYNWFRYNENLFCWDTCRHNNVLLADRETEELAIRNPDAQTDEERYYCTHIATKDITADNLKERLSKFLKALDELIASYPNPQ